MALLTVFVLAVFVGFEVIAKVSSVLHTPLMSGANAIHGVILVGAVIATGAVVAIAGEGRIHARESELLPLSEGAAYFALRSGIPLVPIAINGTSWLRFSGRVRVRVGGPRGAAARCDEERKGQRTHHGCTGSGSSGRADSSSSTAPTSATDPAGTGRGGDRQGNHVEGRRLVGIEPFPVVDDLVVTDESGPIALAGVMGGASTEISGKTTDIVLEAAHWEPASISRAVRRHKLLSEAAKRFERGVDPAIAAVALQRCVDLLVEHGGALAVDGFTVVGDGPAPVAIEV